MPQHAPKPRLSKESLRRLFDAAARFLEAKPWEYTSDSHVVGWTDPTSGEIRIGSVLGNAGLIYAAVILQPWCDAVGIELRIVRHLPAFEAASQSLSEHLRQG